MKKFLSLFLCITGLIGLMFMLQGGCVTTGGSQSGSCAEKSWMCYMNAYQVARQAAPVGSPEYNTVHALELDKCMKTTTTIPGSAKVFPVPC